MISDPFLWKFEDIERLIGSSENMRLEFKQSILFTQEPNRIKDTLSKEISAFANTEGGILVVGIKEARLNRTRVAEIIDDGIDELTWPKERIQQLVEGNIRPPITGLRFNSIYNYFGSNKYYLVIVIPVGNTAHQASDLKYYGRSEFECVPLYDHDIRLRMFKGKMAQAVVRLGSIHIEKFKISKQAIEEDEDFINYSKYRDYSRLLASLGENEIVDVNEYHFDIEVYNSGEVNINEFKTIVEFRPPIEFLFSSLDFRDNWPDPRIRTIPKEGIVRQPLQVNIYPQESMLIHQDFIIIFLNEELGINDLFLDWTLFLRNSFPVRGTINLVQEMLQINPETVTLA